MTYKPLIVVDDDSPEIRRNFRNKSVKAEVNVEVFETWDLTKQYLEDDNPVDAIILDAKGKLTSDSNPGEAHVLESLIWVKARKIPYAFYTAYTDSLEILSQQIAEGRVFTKGKHKEEDVFHFLKHEIANSPKGKYPEPFACFGNDYLDMKYQDLLLNIVLILESDEIKNPEHLLFNPCRIILERVFEKITEIDETVLPYALLNFERQRAGLLNCYKHLSGIPYNLNREREYPANYLRGTENEFISKQLDTIITVCHPGSHEIQKAYSSYTFKSVLWALFDVLIWLKKFVDERK